VSYAAAILLSIAAMYFVEKPARRAILGHKPPKLPAVTAP
jgi:peptidoglycan/LPS O-acetylase OafA/YrhL